MATITLLSVALLLLSAGNANGLADEETFPFCRCDRSTESSSWRLALSSVKEFKGVTLTTRYVFKLVSAIGVGGTDDLIKAEFLLKDDSVAAAYKGSIVNVKVNGRPSSVSWFSTHFKFHGMKIPVEDAIANHNNSQTLAFDLRDGAKLEDLCGKTCTVAAFGGRSNCPVFEVPSSVDSRCLPGMNTVVLKGEAAKYVNSSYVQHGSENNTGDSAVLYCDACPVRLDEATFCAHPWCETEDSESIERLICPSASGQFMTDSKGTPLNNLCFGMFLSVTNWRDTPDNRQIFERLGLSPNDLPMTMYCIGTSVFTNLILESSGIWFDNIECQGGWYADDTCHTPFEIPNPTGNACSINPECSQYGMPNSPPRPL